MCQYYHCDDDDDDDDCHYYDLDDFKSQVNLVDSKTPPSMKRELVRFALLCYTLGSHQADSCRLLLIFQALDTQVGHRIFITCLLMSLEFSK